VKEQTSEAVKGFNNLEFSVKISGHLKLRGEERNFSVCCDAVA